MRDVLPGMLGAAAAIIGFILMRVSAVYENWLLLFVSFAMMIWGIVVLFTGTWRSSGQSVSTDRSD